MTTAVFPEFVLGRLDGFEQGPWRIETGTTSRGGASCNLSERVLRVPLTTDDVARVVRAHELMHIRVNPFHREHVPLELDVSDRALECAEEFRVNYLLGQLGFDVSLLHDGTERPGAQRLAAGGQWDEAVCFFLAVIGTGGESDYLRGLRSAQATWPSALRALKKKVLSVVSQLDAAHIGGTDLTEEGFPRGFLHVTLPIARLVSRSMSAVGPVDPESLRTFRRSLEPGARRPPSGSFAPLVFDTSVDYVVRTRRGAHRRARPATCGTAMLYPSRLLTDPLQRAFAHKATVPGGVIVIDQSGSMDVTVDELDALLHNAPAALIVGYSHRPGDTGRTPNVWILARNGRIATSVRSGNVGNGVDGPVLRWALRAASAREPVVWVTDGQVTDSNDHPCHNLSVECARLVHEHRIHMVRSLRDVRGALRGRRASADSFGRVGRELPGIRGL